MPENVRERKPREFFLPECFGDGLEYLFEDTFKGLTLEFMVHLDQICFWAYILKTNLSNTLSLSSMMIFEKSMKKNVINYLTNH